MSEHRLTPKQLINLFVALTAYPHVRDLSESSAEAQAAFAAGYEKVRVAVAVRQQQVRELGMPEEAPLTIDLDEDERVALRDAAMDYLFEETSEWELAEVADLEGAITAICTIRHATRPSRSA